jgi:hypothetical protein
MRVKNTWGEEVQGGGYKLLIVIVPAEGNSQEGGSGARQGCAVVQLTNCTALGKSFDLSARCSWEIPAPLHRAVMKIT